MTTFPVTFHVPAKSAEPANASSSMEGFDFIIRGMTVRQFSPGKYVAVAKSGDWELLSGETLNLLADSTITLPTELSARLISKFLITSPSKGTEPRF